MTDSEYLKAHDAGLELMGRGSGVPESLCHLADRIESAMGEVLPDGFIAELGRVLLQRRADQAEIASLRSQLRERG